MENDLAKQHQENSYVDQSCWGKKGKLILNHLHIKNKYNIFMNRPIYEIETTLVFATHNFVVVYSLFSDSMWNLHLTIQPT